MMSRSVAQISIVIPVYNRADVVCRTLESVFDQTARPLHVVLVDNGSTDGSEALVREWALRVGSDDFVVKVLCESERGAGNARNRGLAEVETPWTMFFDSDDVMLPDHVSRVLRAIGGNPDVDVFGWDLRAFGPDGVERRLLFEPDSLPWHNLMHGAMSTLRYCARTELFRKAGGWCGGLSTWDDIEFGTRILLHRPKVMKLEGAPTAEIFYSPESQSGPSFAATAAKCLRALDEIAKSYEALGPLSHVRLKKAILAADCLRDGMESAPEILRDVLACEPVLSNRVLYRLVYTYRLCGGRGAARIVKPLLR